MFRSNSTGTFMGAYINELHYHNNNKIYYLDCIMKNTKIKDLINIVKRENSTFYINSYRYTMPKQSYKYFTKRIDEEYSQICIVYSPEECCTHYICKKDNEESENESLYKLLYDNSTIPILKEWIPKIKEKLNISTTYSLLSDNKYVVKFVTNLVYLENIVITLLKQKEIQICDKPASTTIKNIESLDQYITNYSSIISRDILNKFNVKFNKEKDTYSKKLESLSAYTQLKGLKLFNAQKDAIQAVSNNIDNSNIKTTLIVSEMGTGKTILGSASVYVNSKKKSLSFILSPSHLVEKWQREIETYIPDSLCFIIENFKDVDMVFKMKDNPLICKNIYAIISSGKAKIDASKQPSAIYSVAKQKFICPNCGRVLTKLKNTGTGRRKDYKSVPLDYDDFFIYNNDNSFCKKCNTPLWSIKSNDSQWIDLGSAGYVNKKMLLSLNEKKELKEFEKSFSKENYRISNKELSRYRYLKQKEKNDLYTMLSGYIESEGNSASLKDINFFEALSDYVTENKSNETTIRKYPIAKYINKKYKNKIDYLIVDEIHEFSSRALQGQAMANLASASKKIIGLTGTLLNGYADGLFYILYRTMPSLILEDGFAYKDCLKFSEEYGVIKKIQNGRRITKKKYPGVSPLLFTKYMIDNTLFLSLTDMMDGLPSYNEIPIGIDLEPSVYDKYTNIVEQYNDLSSNPNADRTGLVGNVLHLLATYSDQPFGNPNLYNTKTKDILIEVSEPDSGDLYIRSKERALMKIIKEKVADGEKVLVYYNYSNNNVQERLQNIIKKDGFKCSILKTGNAAKREEWINKELDKGLDVLICNPKLVETGLDLLDFTTIVFFDIGYNIFTVRQASRRSWRLSQNKAVEVYFLYYKETVQETTLSIIAQKMNAAMTLEGKFSEEGLRAMTNAEEDIMGQVAKSLKEKVELDIKPIYNIEKRSFDKKKVLSFKKTNVSFIPQTSTNRFIKNIFKNKTNILNII